ncbi:nucleoside phosphorylase domain-containing protein [Aspergillus navahoensis]
MSSRPEAALLWLYSGNSYAPIAIAIICALTLEAEAVEDLFDETYDRLGERYRKEPGDDNAYVNGRIGMHNVAMCYMAGMGKGSAASAASSLEISYKRIGVALVVGLCGGAPYPSSGREVFLGDFIISDSVVQYNFGRQPNRAVCSILASLQARRSCSDLQDKLLQHLQALQQSLPDWHQPNSVDDVLFEASYQHKHYGLASAMYLCLDNTSEDICKAAVDSTCTLLDCDPDRIHIGTVASADTVMKSGEHHDHLIQSEDVIGFKMEGAGVWDNISCIIIKGVSYAAATGAATAKAFLEYWEPTARES